MKTRERAFNLIVIIAVAGIAFTAKSGLAATADALIWGELPPNSSVKAEPLIFDSIEVERDVYNPASNKSVAYAPQAPVSGPMPWVTLLCKFPDVAEEPKDPGYAQQMYSSDHPGLNHYWREASADAIDLNLSVAAGWFTLPAEKSSYLYPYLSLSRLIKDCTAAADDQINFSQFYGINLFFNGSLDGRAYGGGMYLNLDGSFRRWGATWLPPWAYENVTFVSHEMGHAFGFPHSSGNYGSAYDNSWDVMSRSMLCNPSDPVYGCYGQHTIAYNKAAAGWIADHQIKTVPTGYSETIEIIRHVASAADGIQMIVVPVNDSTDFFYTIEVRERVGQDSQLPGEGVIIHEVKTDRMIHAQVIDIDGNGNTGDTGAIWVAGETFVDSENQIAISIEEEIDSVFKIRVLNHPPLFTAVLSSNLTTAAAPAHLTLHAESVGGAGPFAYIWLPGDGCPAQEGEDITHSYDVTGNYLVTLRITDLSSGNVAEDIREISIIDSVPYQDSFAEGDLSGWNFTKGIWSIVQSSLHIEGKKGRAVSPFEGGVEYTIETDIELHTQAGRISILGWYQDDSNFIELSMIEEKQQWKLIHRVAGRKVKASKLNHPVELNRIYQIAMSNQNGLITVEIDGVPALSLQAAGEISGTGVLQVKGKPVAATFHRLSIY